MAEGSNQLTELTDEAVMARVVARDTAAFELLYDRHAAVVLGIVVKIVGDRTVAEELLQETYWRMWTQAGTFDPQKGPLRAWLSAAYPPRRLRRLLQGRVQPQSGPQQ